MISHGIGRQHTLLGLLGVENQSLFVLTESFGGEVYAFAFGVEAGNPAEGDFGVGRNAILCLSKSAFIYSEVLSGHAVAEGHFHFSAFGAKGRVGGEGEFQVLVIA